MFAPNTSEFLPLGPIITRINTAPRGNRTLKLRSQRPQVQYRRRRKLKRSPFQDIRVGEEAKTTHREKTDEEETTTTEVETIKKEGEEKDKEQEQELELESWRP